MSKQKVVSLSGKIRATPTLVTQLSELDLSDDIQIKMRKLKNTPISRRNLTRKCGSCDALELEAVRRRAIHSPL